MESKIQKLYTINKIVFVITSIFILFVIASIFFEFQGFTLL